MRKKVFDIYIGLRGAITYVETIDETNPLKADTYAYDLAIDKFGERPDLVWKALPALTYYPENGRE